ncbi:MAG: 23S rRNA (guanosine(2251)-2'-O)-methyltransferase RlmB [Thermoanaerobacterales bacterium]|jgi:23S rRNA (guanosine2251-2'-O)-methyltransferase|nr:23S rRNA (guanosine(2251)-2'-O)-methyltransferase RlmB [Thermoanaerobacterales bacterium]
MSPRRGRRGAGRAARARRTPPPPTRVTTPGRIRPEPTGRRGAAASRRGLGGDQVEGRQAVRELLIAGKRRVREIWMVDDGDDAPVLRDIRELAEDARVPVRQVGRSRFAAQARCEAPQGVLALAAPLPEHDLDELAAGRDGEPAFLVALDRITDPGNLGAILRSAECAGVTGAVLPRHRAVHVTPTVTKAAAGAVEHVPMAIVPGLPAAILRLRDLGVHVVGLDAAADRTLYDMTGADGPICLVLGSEDRGLSRLVRARCDEVVAIPMRGVLGSLNVAAAAALACFEVARRR